MDPPATPGRPSRTSIPLEQRLDHVIDVTDTSRLLECAQAQRQLQFQQLVRRYRSQILWGCNNTNCTTPTCLSCNKRSPARPFRPPTQLTARATAFFLASQDDPHRGLCPHPLRIPPGELELEGLSGTALRPDTTHEGQEDHVKTVARLSAHRQKRKDPKSLGQNLYDTYTVIRFLVKKIPSPFSITLSAPTRRHHETEGGVEIQAMLPVVSGLDCDTMEQLKEDVDHQRHVPSSDFAFVTDCDMDGKFRRTRPFANRSIYFTLSNCEALLQSFHENTEEFKNSPLPHLNSSRLIHAFRDWNRHNDSLVFDSLWIAVESLFTPPPELDAQLGHDSKNSHRVSSDPHITELPSGLNSYGAPAGRYLSNEEAAHIVIICIHALTSLVPVGSPQTWAKLRPIRASGVVAPPNPADGNNPLIEIIDALEYEPALRLADRLLRGIGARMCFDLIRGQGERRLIDIVILHLKEIERAALEDKETGLERRTKAPNQYREKVDTLTETVTDEQVDRVKAENVAQKNVNTIDSLEKSIDSLKTQINEAETQVTQVTELTQPLAEESKQNLGSGQSNGEDPGWTVTATLIEWLKTIIIKRWDGKADINKWSSVGVAMAILDLFAVLAETSSFNIRRGMVSVDYLNMRLDPAIAAVEFMNCTYRPNTSHILHYPYLFDTHGIVAAFRAIHFTTMLQSNKCTQHAQRLRSVLRRPLRAPYIQLVDNLMNITFSDYLVLAVSREHALAQTLDLLWGQEKRLLLKPLKTKIGEGEGEVGADLGGVTYEFFSVVLSQAFKRDTGMFTVDQDTSMIWFQPDSLEPLWKFEMLGIIFSLAVYNGITLPVTFPDALYLHILRAGRHQMLYKVASPHELLSLLKRGWPTLGRYFEDLLAYQGNVADDICRDYTFDFEGLEKVMYLDIHGFKDEAWDGTHWDLLEALQVTNANPPPEVTNANREQFVKDYIYWLTYRSVAPQLEAFCKGVRTCLHDKACSLVDEKLFRRIVEGDQIISIQALKVATEYDFVYSDPHHPTILDFWSVVEEYDQEQRRKLLAFVTASERVPITGYENLKFRIGRSAQPTDWLPTSSTCFKKLLLPEYESREELRLKLGLAIENCEGFGIA